MDLWHVVLYSSFSVLLWADSHFVFLVKVLLGLLFKLVGLKSQQIIDDFSLVSDSEYFFGKFIVGDSPKWPSGITNFNAHDEMSDCLFDILIAMRTVVQAFSSLGTVWTPIIMPLLESKSVQGNSQLWSGPFIVSHSWNLLIQLFNGGTNFIVAFIAWGLNFV